uniref:hypothetical protein n=1 Tax=Staphylococcus saprophyticus TaxID=29385 RepID=UPI001CDA2FDF
LTGVAEEERGLFMVGLKGLKKWVRGVDMWKWDELRVNVGDDMEIEEFLNKVVNMGYGRESVV